MGRGHGIGEEAEDRAVAGLHEGFKQFPSVTEQAAGLLVSEALLSFQPSPLL